MRLSNAISLTFLLLFCFFLLFLAYFTGLSGPGAATILQMMIGVAFVFIAVINNWLIAKGFFLRKLLLRSFLIIAFLLLFPVIIDFFRMLTEETFIGISMFGVYSSGGILLFCLFRVWSGYFNEKHIK